MWQKEVDVQGVSFFIKKQQCATLIKALTDLLTIGASIKNLSSDFFEQVFLAAQDKISSTQSTLRWEDDSAEKDGTVWVQRIVEAAQTLLLSVVDKLQNSKNKTESPSSSVKKNEEKPSLFRKLFKQ